MHRLTPAREFAERQAQLVRSSERFVRGRSRFRYEYTCHEHNYALVNFIRGSQFQRAKN